MPVLILSDESYKEAFSTIVEGRLPSKYDVITLYYSESRDPRHRQLSNILALADASLQVIEESDLDYVAVVAHSSGCLAALELAGRFPGVIAIGLTGLQLQAKTQLSDRRTALATGLDEKCFILPNVKEELVAFLARADGLYKERLADPIVWYGG